jgi:hypothetical protein
MMELKLSVSIGATLQVKNAKGEWDWIKPEVGAELSITPNELAADLEEGEDLNTRLQSLFGSMWDDVVGPQFKNVVTELIAEPLPKAVESTEEETESEATEADIAVTDEEEYY